MTTETPSQDCPQCGGLVGEARRLVADGVPASTMLPSEVAARRLVVGLVDRVVDLERALVEVSCALGHEWDANDDETGSDPVAWALAQAWGARGRMEAGGDAEALEDVPDHGEDRS